ncbi:unnamed protein product [Prorocentrum cordatum]|uniref:Uncharacterized protein n=1 Tax=Prorocentrum cordatum TaxID=2364126 RepID=A0ABN9TBW7_9DINO|nr:unnamed protein product [Polarella glacialis]
MALLVEITMCTSLRMSSHVTSLDALWTRIAILILSPILSWLWLSYFVTLKSKSLAFLTSSSGNVMAAVSSLAICSSRAPRYASILKLHPGHSSSLPPNAFGFARSRVSTRSCGAALAAATGLLAAAPALAAADSAARGAALAAALLLAPESPLVRRPKVHDRCTLLAMQLRPKEGWEGRHATAPPVPDEELEGVDPSALRRDQLIWAVGRAATLGLSSERLWTGLGEAVATLGESQLTPAEVARLLQALAYAPREAPLDARQLQRLLKAFAVRAGDYSDERLMRVVYAYGKLAAKRDLGLQKFFDFVSSEVVERAAKLSCTRKLRILKAVWALPQGALLGAPLAAELRRVDRTGVGRAAGAVVAHTEYETIDKEHGAAAEVAAQATVFDNPEYPMKGIENMELVATVKNQEQ